MKVIEWDSRFNQQAQWTAPLRKHLLNQLNTPMNKVLEVGSGTSSILRHLLTYKKENPKQLFGVDINFPFLAFSKNNHFPLSHICAKGEFLPFASNVFNLSYCHYLLLWLDNPLVVLAEMKRVTKPGGYIIAFAEPDYGGRIDFPDELTAIGKWQLLSLEQQGADPLIGRKLKSLFHKTKLTEIKTGILGAEWQSPEPEMDELEWELVFHDIENFVEIGQLTRYKEIDKASRSKGQRILYVPTFYAVGEKTEN